MKHLIKIDYDCGQVRTGGRWFIVNSEKIPSLGVINDAPFAGGPMSGHKCTRYFNSDNCDMDSSCNWQRIEDIKPYSEQTAKALRAEFLESLNRQPLEVFYE